MMNGISRFSYKRFIDASAVFAWDREVFEKTWFEYKLQVQNFPEFATYPKFKDFIRQYPDPAKVFNRIHPAIYDNLARLAGKMPQISNAFGEICLSFNDFKFEIIDTDFDDKSKHRIAIEFISEPVLLVGMLGNDFLVAPLTAAEDLKEGKMVPSMTIPKQESLNISAFQQSGF